MSTRKPWLEGPTAKDRAHEKMRQGGLVCLIGVIATAGTYFLFGIVWFLTVIAAVAGFFWFATGLITYYTGIE